MPDLANSLEAWRMWLDTIIEYSSRVQQYRNRQQVCANNTANWTEYACLKGISSAGGASYIGTDEWGIAYFHLTGGLTGWTLVQQEWACNGSTGQPYFNGVVLAGASVAIYDGGSDTRPYDGAAMIPHSGYPVCAAHEWNGTGGGWRAFLAGDAAALTVESCKAGLGLGARSLSIEVIIS